MRHILALLASRWHVEVLVPLVLGASSITSLLFYFYGRMERGHSVAEYCAPRRGSAGAV